MRGRPPVPPQEDMGFVQFAANEVPRVPEEKLEAILYYMNNNMQLDFQFAKVVGGSLRAPMSDVWVPVYAGSANTDGYGSGSLGGRYAATAATRTLGVKRARPGAVAQAAAQAGPAGPGEQSAHFHSSSDAGGLRPGADVGALDPRSTVPRPALFALSAAVDSASVEAMTLIFKAVLSPRESAAYLTDAQRATLRTKLHQCRFTLARPFSVLFRRHPILHMELANATVACLQRMASMRPSVRPSSAKETLLTGNTKECVRWFLQRLIGLGQRYQRPSVNALAQSRAYKVAPSTGFCVAVPKRTAGAVHNAQGAAADLKVAVLVETNIPVITASKYNAARSVAETQVLPEPNAQGAPGQATWELELRPFA